MNNSRLDDDVIRVIVKCGIETKTLDYKSPANWDQWAPASKAEVVRDMMAFANTEHGAIVIGATDQGGVVRDYVGLTEEEAASFDPSKLADLAKRYADPEVDFQLYKPVVDGKKYVVIYVLPFQTVPHICRCSYGGVLEEAAVYVRGEGARSIKIASAEHMRRLMDRAIRMVAGPLTAAIRETLSAPEPRETKTDRHAFDVDLEVMQLASAAFYADVHSGWKDVNGDDEETDAYTFEDNVWGRTKNDTTAGHYSPTAIALAGRHILTPSGSSFDSEHPDSPLLLGLAGRAATDAEIQSHAIWMGLLVNADGVGTREDGSRDRGWVSPTEGEDAPYVKKVPSSAMGGNSYNGGPMPGGGYCWVIGKRGEVFGAYKASDGRWYSGFIGRYP